MYTCMSKITHFNAWEYILSFLEYFWIVIESCFIVLCFTLLLTFYLPIINANFLASNTIKLDAKKFYQIVGQRKYMKVLFDSLFNQRD